MNKSAVRKNYLSSILDYGIYIVFLALILYFAIHSSQFLTISNFRNVLQQATWIGIAAVGMTFVTLIGGIDISIGSNMFVSAVIAGLAMNAGAGWFGGALIVIVIGAIIGSINGYLIAHLRIVPFLATLAVLGILRGIGLWIGDSKLLLLNTSGTLVAKTQVLGIPVTVIILAAILLIGNYILRKVAFGRQLLAIGNDATSAKHIGINVKRNIFSAYVICGILAGLSGYILAGQVTGVPANFGADNEFVVISAAVIGGISLAGGKGNILPGALIGTLMITLILNGLALISASPFVYTIVRGGIIFIAVMVDSIKNSSGLLR